MPRARFRVVNCQVCPLYGQMNCFGICIVDREKMEELRYLSVLGEWSAEEKVLLNRHLAECESCRELVQDYERLALIDLPASSVERIGDQYTDEIDAGEEDRLLGRVVALANRQSEASANASRILESDASPCHSSIRERIMRFLRPSIPLAGWAWPQP